VGGYGPKTARDLIRFFQGLLHNKPALFTAQPSFMMAFHLNLSVWVILCAFIRFAFANVALTVSDYGGITEGKPFTFTWTGANGPVTLVLESGSTSNLRPVATIGCEYTVSHPGQPQLAKDWLSSSRTDWYILYLDAKRGAIRYLRPQDFRLGLGELLPAISVFRIRSRADNDASRSTRE